MTAHEFVNMLKRLRYIDMDQLKRAGVIQPGDFIAWEEFRRNPYIFFINAPDDIAEKIWGLIQ